MATEEEEENEPQFVVNQRSHSRGDVKIVGEAREHGGAKSPVDILDLSQTGCRIMSVSKYDGNRRIYITLPGFAQIEAEIMWHRQFEYGIRFVAPLHISIYEHVLTKFPSLR
jgi:uncharacterized OsmC-like protein